MKPKRSRRLLGAVVAAIGLTATVAVVPAQAEISPNGEATWGVYGLDDDTETDAIDSLVFAIEQIGDRIYVGGKFLEARPDHDGTPVPRPYLAAFDADSGDLITSFAPDVESAVYSLQASPDGTRLFVGGEFRSIDGDNEARGLAALDPMTGAVDPSWRAKATNTSGARGVVHSLTISGDQLYLAGRFDRVGGGPQPLHLTDKVARVALADGSVDTTLATDISGGAVWGVAVAPDGSRVYLAGYHDTVDGDPAGADYAVLDATDGALLSALSDQGGNSNNPNRWYGQDIVAVGDHVFWGGSEHVVRVFRISDGALVRQHSTDRGGDYQDLEVVGDRVYASCHCYTNHYADFDYWPVRHDPIPPGVAVTPIRYVAAYSAVTGEHLPSFSIDASAAKAGIWAIHGDDAGCLWLGGDLTRITTVAGGDRTAGGFAQFCPGDGGDVEAPGAVGDLIQTRAEDHKIVLRWDAATDNVAVDHYEVWRDGVVIGTKPAGTNRTWFTDSGLDAGTDYLYSVVALDGAGNVGPPTTLTATTTGTPPGAGPAAPTGLRSTLQTRDRIVLNWDAVPEAEAYAIERDSGAGFVELATKSGRWYTDQAVSPDTSYTYRIVALGPADEHGVVPRSDPSDPLTVATLP